MWFVLGDVLCIQTKHDLDSEQLLNVRDCDFFFQKRDLNAVEAISNKKKLKSRMFRNEKLKANLFGLLSFGWHLYKELLYVSIFFIFVGFALLL